MKPWEAMQQAIPRHLTEEIAERIGVSPDYIRRMRREPTSDESPTATGQTNPVQRMLQIHDALMLTYPEGAGVLMAYLNSHHDRVQQVTISAFDRHATASACLKEGTEAVNAINIGEDPAVVEKEILEAIAVLNRALICVRAGRLESPPQLRRAG